MADTVTEENMKTLDKLKSERELKRYFRKNSRDKRKI